MLSPIQNISQHRTLLIVFIIVVLGVIIWKLTDPSWITDDGFLDAGLAEIRAQILASSYKNKSPGVYSTSLCPLSKIDGKNGQTAMPCFLGLKDITPGQKPLPELPPVIPRQFPKCLRCEDIINRAISLEPANGPFALGHYLARKKDNNSIVIIPELINGSAVRRATDGNFRLILGLAGQSNKLGLVSIYHPETDSVIARDASGRVSLLPISQFSGSLSPAATFELVDGPVNYLSTAFKCLPIGNETHTQSKYLGFAALSTPGGNPLMVLDFGKKELGSNKELPEGATYEFDLLDIESGIPVIMNKHSGLSCYSQIDGFWDGIASNSDTDSNFESRDKRKVKGLVGEGQLGKLDIVQEEINGIYIQGPSQQYNSGKNTGKNVPRPANQDELMSGLPPMKNEVRALAVKLGLGELAGVERPFASDSFTDIPAPSIGMLPITIEELGRVPSDIFRPAAGLAFNNALNVQNQVYKDQLSDKIFQKLNAAKLSPSVQNILDYNNATYNIYEHENRDFSGKISTQNSKNTELLDNLVAELDKQRVKSMSRDLFFIQNQFVKANARPLTKN